MLEPRAYRAEERPPVEVLIDEQWVPGELHAWFPTGEGWFGNVEYPAEDARRIDTFPGDQIRESRLEG